MLLTFIAQPLGATMKAILKHGWIFLFIVFSLLVCEFPAYGAEPNNLRSQTIKVTNVHIGGFLDPHNQSLIRDTLERAQKNGVTLYVIQLDSNGVAGASVVDIAQDLAQASLVTAIWIGPTGAKYSQELNPILQSVDFVGAASKELAEKSGADIVASSMREFYAELDSRSVDRVKFTLDTGCSEKEIADKTQQCKDMVQKQSEKFALNIEPIFEKLSPIDNLAHALIRPGYALGLIVLGLCLIAFEFYAASVGVSAIGGVIASVCGLYGLAYQPTHWWVVALVAIGVLFLVFDIQKGSVGVSTIGGSVVIFFSSLFVTSRIDDYGVSVVAALFITVMALIMCVGAIPGLIRTRFGTAMISRDLLIGEEGMTVGVVNNGGIIQALGAKFKARSQGNDSIQDGQVCTIIATEDNILEISPKITRSNK